LGRLSAHTGAAALGAAGATEGYREKGIPGMIAGGLTGIVAPELASSPTAQMIMARGMHGAFPQLVAPATTAVALQANRKDNPQ